MNVLSARPVARPATTLRAKLLGVVAASTAILSGSIQAQIIPAQVTTRNWDAAVGTAGTFNWGDAVNWSADTLPGLNDIANFSPAPGALITVDLGGVSREVGALFFSGNGASNYQLQNGTLVANSLNQNNDDANITLPTAIFSTKNGGADILNVSVSSNTFGMQGELRAGGINKFGGGTLRLGTSGTNFNNVINGDITIYNGTLTAAAGATSGSNNPLAGSGDVVIGAPGATLSLTANGSLATGAEYDFVRNIRAGNNNFTLDVRLAGGTDSTDPNMRAGTLTIGNATVTVNQGNGFRAALDGITILTGATNTRLQLNALTFVDGLTGDAASNLYKRGGSDLEIRGNSEATFAGKVFLGESNTRFLSTGAGLNPMGGADSTVVFSNGYGLNAIAGGQTLQLRSNASIDFGSNLAFRPGVTIGTVDVNNGGSGTGQTLSLGDVNISARTLRVTGGNTFRLGLDNVTVDAGSTAIMDTSGADVNMVGTLSVGAGATLNKIGGNQLFLNTDNTSTAVGAINLRAGSLAGNVAGSLGSGPIKVGLEAPDSNGFFGAASRLNINATGALANTNGIDVTVFLGGAADFNSTPAPGDIFDIRAGGRIQGTAAQLGALTAGGNLILSADAIISHEAPGAVTGTVASLPNTASYFYGLAGTANTLPNIGANTPWKGVLADNTSRTVQGVDAATPAILNVEGGDGLPDTIEAYVGGMFGQRLNLGTTTAADGEFKWNSVSGQRVTIGVRGFGGSTALGFVPGGDVALNELNSVSNMSTHVDNIIVEQGALLLPGVGFQGGVPIELRNGGSLDIGNVAGNVIDGNVTVKTGGVFFFNDNQVLGGAGTVGTITFETGSILDISGSAPSTFFSAAVNPMVFTGTNHTVRFAASNITDLDAKISNVAPTYVIAGGGTAANLGESGLSVTTNLQTSGITLENGIVTNDGTSRGFDGPINLNNTNLTVAATRGTSLGVLSAISTTQNVQVGSDTAIDFRDKNANPDRLSGLGLLNPHDGHSQVLFLGSVSIGGNVNVASGTRLGFASPSTNIAGDLNFGGTVLYLDGGGELNSGASTRGGLTARLTDTSNNPLNRVANQIILGDYARVEMGITGAGPHTITQPFVVSGRVNPVDKRTFWVDRADFTTGAPAAQVFFSDVLLKPNAQIGFDESNSAIRSNLRLEGNGTLIRNHDDYDLRNISKAAGAPASVTLFAGEPTFGWDDATEYLVNGSNAVLVSSVDGTIEAGVTVDMVRVQLFFEQNAVLNGVVRSQTAPNRGDSYLVSRSSGLTTPTTFAGTGEIQLGRSVAANGPEDFDIRGTEASSGQSPLHTVAVPVRVVNDASASNIDAIIRSDRHNDSTSLARVQLNTVNVEAGATIQFVSAVQASLTVPQINVGANGGIDSTNNTTVFIGNVTGAGAARFTGPAQARITGNISAGEVNVSGAGLDFDPGAGNTSTVGGDLSLSGALSVRSGSVDLGSGVITGVAPQMVAGLREHKIQGAFDETTPNTSNEVKLGPVLAQLPTNAWGENQTVTYTGQIFIPDNGASGDGQGSVAFAKWFDDNVRVVIGGSTVLRSTAFNDGVGNSSASLPVGWHDIEIRLGQGTGGAGPVGQDGNAFNLGLGIDITGTVSTQTAGGVGNVIDGSQYANPLDDGSMNLFRTTTVKGIVNLAAGTNLKAAGFSNLGNLTYGGASATVNLAANGAANSSSATAIAVSGAVSGSTLNIAEASDTVSVENLQLGTASDSFAVTGAGNLTVTAAGSGTGGMTFNSTGTLQVNGTVPGTVTVSNGVLTGNGTIGSLLIGDAIVAPGSSPGVLTTGSLVGSPLSEFVFELGSPLSGSPVAGTDYDQINVTGSALDLNGAGLTLAGLNPLKVGDVFTIILKGGTEQAQGFFSGVDNGATLQLANGSQVVISYFDDASTPQFESDSLGGGNDVSLQVVPEPGSAVLLLGGLASVAAMRRRRLS